MDLAVVRPNDALCEVAPEMGGRGLLRGFFGERFVSGDAGKELLSAEMLATRRGHTSPFSLSSVRRMSACAMGTL